MRRREHVDHGRSTGGDRARLVEDERLGCPQLFEHRSALHHDAPSCRPRQPGDERHWCGEDQRARRGHDEHVHGPHQLPGDEPRGAGEAQAGSEEGQCPPIGQTDEAGARGAGLLDQTDEAGVGRIRGVGRGPQVERAPCVHPPAADEVTDQPLDWPRFARQRALVDHGRGVRDHPVDGDHLAVGHHQQVTDPDLREVHRLELTAVVEVGGPWRSVRERPQLPVGATLRPRLERPTGGEHQGDDRSGQVLAHHKCPDECQQGDHVDAHATLASGADHQEGASEDAEHRGPGPHRRRRPRGPGEPTDPARCHAGGGHGEEGS